MSFPLKAYVVFHNDINSFNLSEFVLLFMGL